MIALFVVASCSALASVCASGIEFTQPTMVSCSESLALQWEYTSKAMETLSVGDKINIELWHDAFGFSNKKVALVATVDYPKKFYDFKAPNKLFEDWSTIYNGNYASYFRIVSADEEFNNDPWFGWPSWEWMGCDDPISVDCKLSNWGSWGDCSPNCGANGRKKRTRTIETERQGSGQPCEELSETELCFDLPACAEPGVDCVVGTWSDWSVCNSPCGVGAQIRSRKIEQAAEGGGEPCPEKLRDTQSCNGAEINKQQCEGDRGCEQCQCKEDGSCNSGLACHSVTQTCLTEAELENVGSEPGTKANPCKQDGTCNSPLVCQSNRCVDLGGSLCISGALDCPCDNGRCGGSLRCDSLNNVCVKTNGVGSNGSSSGTTPGDSTKDTVDSPSTTIGGIDFSSTPVIAGLAAAGAVCLLCCVGIVIGVCLCVGKESGGPKYGGDTIEFRAAGTPAGTVEMGGMTGSYDAGGTYPSAGAYPSEIQSANTRALY